MPNNRLPYFPFYVRDFVSDSKVESMSTLAVGSYMLLLCKAWHEDPPGSIPDSDPLLARWARITLDQWLGVKREVLAAFSLGSDLRWHQKRLRHEYDKLTYSKNHKTEVTRKAALSRWMKKIDADALQKHSKRKAPAMHSVSVSEYESVFEVLWSKYPSKEKKQEAKKAFCKSIKSSEDLDLSKQALDNYLTCVDLDRKNGFNRRHKNGDVWFRNWRDWVEWKPPSLFEDQKKSFSGPAVPV